MWTEKQIIAEIEDCRKVVAAVGLGKHGAESKKCQIIAHALCQVLEYVP